MKYLFICFLTLFVTIGWGQLPAPVAHYDFTGGSAADISGNGLNGTIFGATAAVDRCGNADGALSFNGFTNYVDIPYDPLFNIPVNGAWNRSD